MNMKSKIYEFKPVLYPFPLFVTKKYDIAELEETFVAPDGAFEELEYTVARCCQVESRKSGRKGFLIFIESPKDCATGVCAHESLHVLNMYADALGFPPMSAAKDEPQAYFIQWISSCIMSVLVGHPEFYGGILLEGF